MKYLLMVCLMTMNSASAFAAEQVEEFTAKLFTAKGTVECQKKGAGAWAAVEAPYLLEVGDQVRTGAKSKAEIYIKYGSKVRLGADTTFAIDKVSPTENSVNVLRGKMQAWIRKFVGRGFSVRTPAAVCAVRGTVFGVEVSEAGQTTWDLFSGSIQIADNRNRTVDLVPNQRLEVSQAEGAAAAPVAIPPTVEVPSEPAKIKEEKAEIKAELVIVEAKAKEEAALAKPEVKEEAVEEAAAVIEEPATTVIATQEIVQGVCEVSPSSPDCQGAALVK